MDWCRACTQALLCLTRPTLIAPPNSCAPLGAVAGPHEGLLRRAVLTHKRGPTPGVRTVLIALLAYLVALIRPPLVARGLWRPPLAMAPVPPSGWHPSRVPMAELAAPVARECAAYTGPLLRAARRRRPQKGLGAAARASNVRHAFRADPSRAPPGLLGVVIIDDVITTGASMVEAARAVREAGLLPVAVVALARADVGAQSPLG